MNKITTFVDKHPKATAYISNMIETRKTRLYQDIIFCLAITLASSFYFYEHFQPKMEVMRAIITVLMVVIWLGMALVNGFKLRYGFMIFSLSFWFIPQLFILWHNNFVANGEYTKNIDILANVVEIIFVNPIITLNSYISKFSNFSEVDLTLIFIITITITFLLGWIIRTKLIKIDHEK